MLARVAGKRRPGRPAGEPLLIPVGEVARPHGVRGELRVKLYNPDSTLFTQTVPSSAKVRLRLTGGQTRDLELTSARAANGAVLLRLEGVDDRDAADALRGAEVLIPRDDFAPLAEGEFYACDIEGARAVLPSGEELGHVKGLASYPTCDVLIIERKGGGPLEVPLLEPYVGKVDVDVGVVEILSVEGLE